MSEGYSIESRIGLTLGPEYGGPLSVAMCSEDEADGEATLFPFRATNDDGTNADACFLCVN